MGREKERHELSKIEEMIKEGKMCSTERNERGRGKKERGKGRSDRRKRTQEGR